MGDRHRSIKRLVGDVRQPSKFVYMQMYTDLHSLAGFVAVVEIRLAASVFLFVEDGD